MPGLVDDDRLERGRRNIGRVIIAIEELAIDDHAGPGDLRVERDLRIQSGDAQDVESRADAEQVVDDRYDGRELAIWADLDEDGDDDLVISGMLVEGGNGVVNVYENLTPPPPPPNAVARWSLIR